MSMLSCRKALTLVEVVIVSFIASLVMLSIFMIWTRTGSTATKGGEMLDLQSAVRSINDRMRSDVRTLCQVVSATESKIIFLVYLKGEKIEVTYEHDLSARTLTRKTCGHPGVFRADGLVAKAIFSCHPSLENFEYLQLALELESQGQGNVPTSKLAQIMVFSSRSFEPAFVKVK